MWRRTSVVVSACTKTLRVRRFEPDAIAVRGLIDGGTSISSPLKVVPVEAESFKLCGDTRAGKCLKMQHKNFKHLLESTGQQASTPTKGSRNMRGRLQPTLWSIEGLEADNRLTTLSHNTKPQRNNTDRRLKPLILYSVAPMLRIWVMYGDIIPPVVLILITQFLYNSLASVWDKWCNF